MTPMSLRVSKTEAGRRRSGFFHGTLHRVEQFAMRYVARGVAVIDPRERSGVVTLAELRRALVSLPPPDGDFATDLERLRKASGLP